ncbi:MAG: flagellar protein FlaG [Thermodesulfobacteriota bacterium]|nr:flagellar protein FlaG [Thermodesulfobacteriota bacterium]
MDIKSINSSNLAEIKHGEPAIRPQKESGNRQSSLKINEVNQKDKTGKPGKQGEDPKLTQHLEQIAKAVDEFLKTTGWNLKLKVNGDTDRVVALIVSEEKGEVIKQIPSEELLELYAKMEEMVGKLVNDKV